MTKDKELPKSATEKSLHTETHSQSQPLIRARNGVLIKCLENSVMVHESSGSEVVIQPGEYHEFLPTVLPAKSLEQPSMGMLLPPAPTNILLLIIGAERDSKAKVEIDTSVFVRNTARWGRPSILLRQQDDRCSGWRVLS